MKQWAVASGQWSGRFAFAIVLLTLVACHRTNISRAQWEQMPRTEKTLYVQTLLGHENTKEAKGGNDRVFTQSAGAYVSRIDDAYAHGDRRSVDAIFEEMGIPR
ncbi:MAG: hypothetical protein M3P29_09625 [Acidobacteriota bacterium]|nr:hypothetical protein [Acidobacteriota bacterium]